MGGPPAELAAVRVAVRRALAEHVPGRGTVLVACSGGADSLALMAATAFVGQRRGLRTGAVVVDHGLQEHSEQVAGQAARVCRELGADPVEVVRVRVGAGAGPEDAARSARLGALAGTAAAHGATAVLLGHTLDDQAEQVLLGLTRGAGARSLSGMPAARSHGRPPVLLLRPLLGVPRSTTEAACRALGLSPWSDPHNVDERFTRVRARALLPLLEQRLGPGVVSALARSADLLRTDADALDDLAATAYGELGEQPWAVQDLDRVHRAVRMRVWRRLVLSCGVPPGALLAEHLGSLDALVTRWRGQGPVDLPGGLLARRTGDRVSVGPGGRVG